MSTRKLFTSFFALVLALALPLTGFAAANYALYTINNVEVAVPHIGRGREILVAASSKIEVEQRLGYHLLKADVESKAYAELLEESQLEVYALAGFLPKGADSLFNKRAGFAGPNCYNSALVCAQMMPFDKLRHMSTDEMEHILEMYYHKVPVEEKQPGDIIVYNRYDHVSFYLGHNLVFHKKSYLKEHLFRVCEFDKVYEEDVFEWKPNPFHGGYNPFHGSSTIRQMDVYRKSDVSYEMGEISDLNRKRLSLITFMMDNVLEKCPGWKGSKDIGYFSERLLENLVSDFSDMSKTSDPVLELYYHQLSSMRDQMNQSIEMELLSSPYAQSNAHKILKEHWFPQNDYSKTVVQMLLSIYGKDSSDESVSSVCSAIALAYDKSPLLAIR